MSTARDCCLGIGLSFRDGGTCQHCIGKQFIMPYHLKVVLYLRGDGTDMLYEAIHKPIVVTIIDCTQLYCTLSVLYRVSSTVCLKVYEPETLHIVIMKLCGFKAGFIYSFVNILV